MTMTHVTGYSNDLTFIIHVFWEPLHYCSFGSWRWVKIGLSFWSHIITTLILCFIFYTLTPLKFSEWSASIFMVGLCFNLSIDTWAHKVAELTPGFIAFSMVTKTFTMEVYLLQIYLSTFLSETNCNEVEIWNYNHDFQYLSPW